MSTESFTIAQALAAHPGWMSGNFLHFIAGGDRVLMGTALEVLERAGKVERSQEHPPYWRWADPSTAEGELAPLSEAERRALHLRLFEYVKAQEFPDEFAAALAYHAARAGLREQACAWHLRAGQVFSATGNFEAARKHLEQALAFASGGVAQAQVQQQIGNLECHLGRFRDAEAPYREALAKLEAGGDPSNWIRCAQSLAAALVEQGKFRGAIEWLDRCAKRLEGQDLPLEKAVINLHLTQVRIGLGMMREAEESLRQLKGFFSETSLASLAPYEQLLEGKLELIQGHLAASFRIFEEAARGFEAQGDLAGKLEVLLSISAPLMEHYLVQQASALIDQVSAWQELANYPALEHSVHLRRLALGAFSGKWVQGDLGLLAQEELGIGRAEDWLQFWFHLSLAARRLKDGVSASAFLGKARAVVERSLVELEPQQQESFLRRPDIARIWRLSSPRGSASGEEQKVRAKRRLPEAGPAEAATLAPPSPTAKSEK
ncbi:MAG: tetratricopeptide repeat protein [bacterium]